MAFVKRAGNGLQAAGFRPEIVIAGQDTEALIDQIRTIDTSYVTGEHMDYLSSDDMAPPNTT